MIADLLPRWLELYNEDYADTLCAENITDWDTQKFVKPDCGERIFHYLHRADLYDNVEPIPGALEGVRALRDLGHRVVFVTSCVNGNMASAKIDWMFRHGFLDEPSHVGMKDLIIMQDKSLVRGDLMIDDYVKNLEAFGGLGVLFSAPYNGHVRGYTRADDWHSVYHGVSIILGDKV